MARSRHPKRRTLAEQLERLPPEFLRTVAENLEILRAWPGATRVLVNPAAIPPNPRQALKWLNAVKNGKPVPVTVDYLDGTPALTIERPISNKRPPRPPGRPPHPLTLARFVQFADDHPELGERRLAEQLTIALNAELGPTTKPVTRAIVRERRREADAARRRRSAPRKKEGPGKLMG